MIAALCSNWYYIAWIKKNVC